jgi:TnpA family transposase
MKHASVSVGHKKNASNDAALLQARKAYWGSRGIVTFIYNLNTGWR